MSFLPVMRLKITWKQYCIFMDKMSSCEVPNHIVTTDDVDFVLQEWVENWDEIEKETVQHSSGWPVQRWKGRHKIQFKEEP